MSKTTKFLCLVSDSEWMASDLHPRYDSDFRERVRWHDSPYIRVIECAHPNLEDNEVTVDMQEILGECYTTQFLKDINGDMWYVDDVWDKTQIINSFE